MDMLHAVVLGVVQGLTEFLPVSSSAHLIVVPWLFHWPEPGLAFNVALHLGTLTAVIAYFWRDLLEILHGVLRGLWLRRPLADPMGRLGWIIVLGSIPAAIAGIVLQDAVDRFFHAGEGGRGAIALIALVLMLVALLLALAERLATHRRPLSSITGRDGLLIGLAQMTALVPGVSRSGSTITAGLFLGLRREAAARFSFLLGTPAILGAGLLESRKLLAVGLDPGERGAFLLGFLTAALTGYLAIAFLLRYLQRRSTLVFVGYRVFAGLVLLVLVLLR